MGLICPGELKASKVLEGPLVCGGAYHWQFHHGETKTQNIKCRHLLTRDLRPGPPLSPGNPLSAELQSVSCSNFTMFRQPGDEKKVSDYEA